MINDIDIEEIKNRDFLKFYNHINRFDNINSHKIYGENKKTFVSILMPIYNHPVICLKNAILSALDQLDFEDYKIVIVDNSSTVVNENVVLEFNSPKIVYYKNEKNLGLFGNWNRCIKLANSEWITFLHSDDMLCRDFLRTMCVILKKHPEIDQLACKYTIHDVDSIKQYNVEKSEWLECKQLFGEDYNEFMITSVKGAMIKREYIMRVGGFRDKDNGLGLGDYTAMLQYAYKYNVYLLNGNLYLNGWGENDTINVSIWYPELVANYYMQIFFANKAGLFKRIWKKYNAKMILIKRAYEFDNGTSFVGKRVSINWDELKKDCNINSIKINPVFSLFVKILNKIEINNREIKRNKFRIKR